MVEIERLAILCRVCGNDLAQPGQWLRCREHYADRIRELEAELALAIGRMRDAAMEAARAASHCECADSECPTCHQVSEIARDIEWIR